MKIAGCVVLYNPTMEVLDNINTYIDEIEKLYIYDNSSNDYFLEKLKKTSYFSKIEYMTENYNKGIAYALNRCCQRAIEEKFDWILTMDQDSKFVKKSISVMKQKIKDEIAIIAPSYDLDSFYDGSDLVVMTSGNLLNLKIFNKLHGFMEYLFIDMVDYEYCLRVRINNYDIVKVKDIKLIHKLGNIKYKKIFHKKIYYTNHPPIRRYYITRNRFILYDLYYQQFPIFLKKELLYNKKEMIKVILFENQKLKKIKMYLKAKQDYKKWRKDYEKS